MRINPDKCVACGNCTYVCPMGAIYIDPAIKRATVDRNECVECYACFNGLSQEHLNPTLVRTLRKLFQMVRLRFDPEPDVCPTAAFDPEELQWPRVVRRAFSDPRVPHESTGVQGRGTEEVKTNDVTGRVKEGEVGFTIEFGRPGVGVWFHEIQKMTWALAKAGVAFEKKNPITSLMTDVATGTLREDILGEKMLSAIVEIKVPVARTEEIIRLVREVEQQVDTVIALGVGARCDASGEENVVGADPGAPGIQTGAGQNQCRAGQDYQPGGGKPAGAGAGDSMTNTLHRFGDAASFYDDYVIFAIPSRGKNEKGSVPKLKKFLEMALPFKPVNLGDAIHGGALRPSRNMHPTSHWKRDMEPDFRAVIDGVDTPTTVAAVFDNRVAAEDFLKTVRQADLGLCINISTSIDGAEQCCHAAEFPGTAWAIRWGSRARPKSCPTARC